MKHIWGLYSPYYLLILLTIYSQGCASIMTGTSQNYEISSTPEGAYVKIEHGPDLRKNIFVWEGTAPAIVKLRREYEYKVTISLDGYKTEEVLLGHSTNGWRSFRVRFYQMAPRKNYILMS